MTTRITTIDIAAPLVSHAPARQDGYDDFDRALKTRSEHPANRRSFAAS